MGTYLFVSTKHKNILHFVCKSFVNVIPGMSSYPFTYPGIHIVNVIVMNGKHGGKTILSARSLIIVWV